jgi:cysteine-rich repeat protein
VPIVNGTTSFSTVHATTDGTLNSPLPPGVDCHDSGATPTANDIWFRYTATCSGILTVSTCPQLGGTSNYDTDLVLYPGNVTCPPASTQIIACNDDDQNHPCGQAAPWQSTLLAGVTTGQTYLLRVGGWNSSTDRGTGVLWVNCGDQFCGNGLMEPGEQCDDGNNIPGDGCTNCTIDADCSAACTLNENETCVQGPDTVNGGCNTTPALYTPIELVGGGAVICGTAWAKEVNSTGTRDLDWYTVTIGPSGQVQAHITATSLMPMLVFVGSATGPPNPHVPCGEISFTASALALNGECEAAVRTGMTPGSTAIVVTAPNVFMGFPCSGGPWTYRLRIVSQ